MANKNPKLKLRGKVAQLLNRLAPQQPEQSETMTMPPPAKGDIAFRLSGMLTAVILLLVLLFSAVLGTRLYSMMGMGSNQYKNIPIVYTKADGALKFTHPFVEEPITVNPSLTTAGEATVLNETVWLSQSGKQMLYIDKLQDGRGELYLRDVTGRKENDEDDSRGVLVATGVRADSVSFSLSDKAVVYLRSDTTDDSQSDLLCYHTAAGESILELSCVEVLLVEQSGEVLFLQKINGGQAIRQLTLPKKAEEDFATRTIDSFVIDVMSVAPQNHAYTKSDGEGGYSLYRWDGKATSLLAVGTDRIVDISPGGEVFFLEETKATFDPMRYFEDDLQRDDRLLQEPLEENYMVEKKNIWGKVTTSLDKDAYEKAQEAYDEKLQRDKIRSAIEKRKATHRTYSLYYSNGTVRELIDTDIMELQNAEAAAGTAVYYKERSSISERPLISQIVDVQEAQRMIDSILNNTLRDYYAVAVGTEPIAFQTISKNEELRSELDGKRGLYFIKSDAETDGTPVPLSREGGTLYYAPFEQGELGLAKKLDSRVTEIDSRKMNGQRLYYRLSGELSVDLYAVTDGKKTRLAAGLSLDTPVFLHGDYLVGYRSYHQGRRVGELVQIKGTGVQGIATKVHYYSYRTDDYIYLLMNYDVAERYGDLYLYTGGNRLKLVERQVSAIVS